MYQSLFNLPQLAGLSSVGNCFDSRSWSVDQAVKRWKRIHYCLRQLCELLTARITSEPIYELKLIYSHHAYLLAEQVSLVRKRVSEMREPPLGLDKIPHQGLERLMTDCGRCSDRLAFLSAAYEVILPKVAEACRAVMLDAHPIADAPSVRAAKLIEFELRDLIRVGEAALASLNKAFQEGPANVDLGSTTVDLLAWRAHLDGCIQAAGGLDGKLQPELVQSNAEHESTLVDLAGAADDVAMPEPFVLAEPFQYSSIPKRDSRFRDSYNAGVNAEAFLYDERFSAQDKTLMMYYKRLREIDVPEAMASILCELDDKPWDFYREMYRQLWDEARHAMMGEIGFASQGIDWTKIPINFTWSLNLNSQLTPQERHGVLFFIEQGLMTRTGKRYEWEIAQQSHDPLSALFQDFDWADEVLHAQIGQRWYVKQFESLKEALKYGDECWSRVMSRWSEYRALGLTDHRNWWPELYRIACQKWNKQPDANAEQFDVSYNNTRADLKQI